MRRLFISTLAILLIAGVAFAATSPKVVTVQSTAGTPRGDSTLPVTGIIAGQGKHITDPHRTFRMVRYVPETATELDYIASQDMIVVWDSISGDDGVTVTLGALSNDSRVAGVLAVDTLPPISTDTVSTAVLDIGKRNWTWLQTYGKCEVSWGEATAGEAGDAFGTCANLKGFAMRFPGDQTDFGSLSQDAAAQGCAGFLYDAAAAQDTDDIEAFVRCE